jgi:hypothetical protein
MDCDEPLNDLNPRKAGEGSDADELFVDDTVDAHTKGD